MFNIAAAAICNAIIVKCEDVHRYSWSKSMSDIVALASYALVVVALAYFMLEFILTGINDRISKAIMAALRR